MAHETHFEVARTRSSGTHTPSVAPHLVSQEQEKQLRETFVFTRPHPVTSISVVPLQGGEAALLFYDAFTSRQHRAATSASGNPGIMAAFTAVLGAEDLLKRLHRVLVGNALLTALGHTHLLFRCHEPHRIMECGHISGMQLEPLAADYDPFAYARLVQHEADARREKKIHKERAEAAKRPCTTRSSSRHKPKTIDD